MRKILCLIGFHKWDVKDAWLIKRNVKYTRKCKYCGKLKPQSGLSVFLKKNAKEIKC